MKIKNLLFTVFAVAAVTASAQTKKKKSAVIAANTPVVTSTDLPRPKLVVGIVVDQMRWDYLYR